MDYRTERLLNDFRDADELDADEVRARLQARSEHPDLYLAAQERRASQERDEQDRAEALDSWLRAGGDPKGFDKEWSAISTEAKRIQMLEREHAARESFERYGRENF